jgi:hypothetical protein
MPLSRQSVTPEHLILAAAFNAKLHAAHGEERILLGCELCHGNSSRTGQLNPSTRSDGACACHGQPTRATTDRPADSHHRPCLTDSKPGLNKEAPRPWRSRPPDLAAGRLNSGHRRRFSSSTAEIQPSGRARDRIPAGDQPVRANPCIELLNMSQCSPTCPSSRMRSWTARVVGPLGAGALAVLS